MKKIKENLFSFVLSIVVMLIPMLAGSVLWNQFPDQIPIHWNLQGQIDGYGSKALAVFGLPLILITMDIVLVLLVAYLAKDAVSNKLFNVIMWIEPLVGVLVGIVTYVVALGGDVDVVFLCQLYVGLIYIVIGNYLPKARPNPYVGIRVKWTMESKRNWEKTHRFSAKLVVVLGVFLIFSALTGLLSKLGDAIALIVLAVAFTGSIVAMIVYSYRYYVNHHEEDGYFMNVMDESK